MVEDILHDLIARYPSVSELYDELYVAYDLICSCYDAGGKLLLCGNGGSAADCDHIVGELMKGFKLQRKLQSQDRGYFEDLDYAAGLADRLQGGLPAISLCTQGALMTAYANDVDPEMIFAQQVWVYGKNSPDLLIALSTSGNSANVLRAVETANALGLDSIGITGAKGGRLKELCTACICLPETETYKVQELTLPVYHALCAAVEHNYFGAQNI